jgi:glycosyltransferase involved in cell wall biosynthesis
MHVLNLSTDKKILEPKSRLAERMTMIGKGVSGEYHIIVFTKRAEGYVETTLGSNVFVHPTNSYSVFGYKKDAIRIAKKLQQAGKVPKGQSLVTAQNPFEAGLIGIKVAQKLGLPLEVQIHTDFLNPYYRNMSWRHRLHPMLAKKVISQAQGIRVVSQVIEKQIKILSYCKAPVTVLPVFAETETSSEIPRHNLEGQHVLMISRLEKEKNVIAGVRIFNTVSKNFPEARLTIVGEGSERASIETYIKKNNLTDVVTLVGREENIQPFLESADVFLHTSYFEGYGLVFLEAGATSLPIVSYDVGVVSDFGQRGGALLCPVGDETCMVSNLKKILGDSQEKGRVGKEAFQCAKDLLWDKIRYVETLVNNWQEIVTRFNL